MALWFLVASHHENQNDVSFMLVSHRENKIDFLFMTVSHRENQHHFSFMLVSHHENKDKLVVHVRVAPRGHLGLFGHSLEIIWEHLKTIWGSFRDYLGIM